MDVVAYMYMIATLVKCLAIHRETGLIIKSLFIHFTEITENRL